jgi:hypothetical protein
MIDPDKHFDDFGNNEVEIWKNLGGLEPRKELLVKPSGTLRRLFRIA